MTPQQKEVFDLVYKFIDGQEIACINLIDLCEKYFSDETENNLQELFNFNIIPYLNNRRQASKYVLNQIKKINKEVSNGS